MWTYQDNKYIRTHNLYFSSIRAYTISPSWKKKKKSRHHSKNIWAGKKKIFRFSQVLPSYSLKHQMETDTSNLTWYTKYAREGEKQMTSTGPHPQDNHTHLQGLHWCFTHTNAVVSCSFIPSQQNHLWEVLGIHWVAVLAEAQCKSPRNRCLPVTGNTEGSGWAPPQHELKFCKSRVDRSSSQEWTSRLTEKLVNFFRA